MIKSEFIAKAAGLFIFYRWHPEVALRYLPVAEKIRSLGKSTTVLEVGSGGLGIAPYLKRDVTGVDTHFDRPFHPQLKQVIGTAVKIPFAKNSFDVVISADMLEHIKKDERKKAISEMIRVAKKLAIIAVPCGKFAQKEDEFLTNKYYKMYGKNFHFMQEQVTLGLPNEEEIVEMVGSSLKEQKKIASINVEGNESIILHRFLMRGWMDSHILAQLFFRKILLLAIPLMRHINSEHAYRKIITVSIRSK